MDNSIFNSCQHSYINNESDDAPTELCTFTVWFSLSTLIKTVFNSSRPVFQKTCSGKHTRHDRRSFKHKVVNPEQADKNMSLMLAPVKWM